MGDTTTPVIGLVKPLVGASRSTWGNKWNGNADDIDAFCEGLQQQIAALAAEIAGLAEEVAGMAQEIAQLGADIGAVYTWVNENFKPIGSYTPNQNVDIGSSPQWFVGNFANSATFGGYGIAFPPYGPHYFDFEFDGVNGGVYVRVDAGPTALIGTVSRSRDDAVLDTPRPPDC